MLNVNDEFIVLEKVVSFQSGATVDAKDAQLFMTVL